MLWAARRAALAAAIACVLFAVGEAARAQPAAPGTSVETAIVLPGVQHEAEGVGAEYAYIRQHFPGCKPGTQALLSANGRRYDSIHLVGQDCPPAVFFDITDWFGR